jgi:hypothetical protein
MIELFSRAAYEGHAARGLILAGRFAYEHEARAICAAFAEHGVGKIGPLIEL